MSLRGNGFMDFALPDKMTMIFYQAFSVIKESVFSILVKARQILHHNDICRWVQSVF